MNPIHSTIDAINACRSFLNRVLIQSAINTSIPAPLDDFYTAFGSAIGAAPYPHSTARLFQTQDCFVPLAQLREEQGRVTFLNENQGCWSCATEASACADGTVWVQRHPAPPQPLEVPLSEFLITAMLFEAIMSAQLLAAAESIEPCLPSGPLTRLWQGTYAWPGTRLCFWGNGDGSILAMGTDDGVEWIASNRPLARELEGLEVDWIRSDAA